MWVGGFGSRLTVMSGRVRKDWNWALHAAAKNPMAKRVDAIMDVGCRWLTVDSNEWLSQ